MMALNYIEQIEEIIKKVKATQMDAIHEASSLIKEAVKNERLVHVFGCGHSQMYAEEIFTEPVG